ENFFPVYSFCSDVTYSPNADVTVITACIAFLINFKLRLCHKDGNEIDGNVIILTAPKSEIKFFDSDTVSCIANLSRLPSRI
ncbi:hypothetical protein ACSLO7_30790, partial [Klebsiella pneumoniae]